MVTSLTNGLELKWFSSTVMAEEGNISYAETLMYYPSVWTTEDGKKYIVAHTIRNGVLGKQYISWRDAEAVCERWGGHLVTITSQKEQNQVLSIIKKDKEEMSSYSGKDKEEMSSYSGIVDDTSNYWIGCYRDLDTNRWTWLTGEEAAYFNWDINEPNNYKEKLELCVHLKSNGKWNDATNAGASYASQNYALGTYGFICEIDQYNVEYSCDNYKVGTVKFPSTVKNKTDLETTYYYSDSYFEKDSTEYNPSLSTMSLLFSLAAGGTNEKGKGDKNDRERNVIELLSDLGFDGIDTKSYNIRNEEVPGTTSTENSIAYALGYKNLNGSEKNTTVIAVGIRGLGYGLEWSNNFKMGDSGTHQGFEQSARKVSEGIEDFISNNRSKIGLDKGPKRIVLWITGYSRAGAVANILAGKLLNGSFQIDTGDGNLFVLKDNVYAYCFEPAQGEQLEEVLSDNYKYNSIFNIVNPNDLVTYMAPKNKGFNFARYGRTHILPFKRITANYDALKECMLDTLGQLLNTFNNQPSMEVMQCWDEVTTTQISEENDYYDREKILEEVYAVDDFGAVNVNGLKKQNIYMDECISQLIDICAEKIFIDRETYQENYQQLVSALMAIANCKAANKEFMKAFEEEKTSFFDEVSENIPDLSMEHGIAVKDYVNKLKKNMSSYIKYICQSDNKHFKAALEEAGVSYDGDINSDVAKLLGGIVKELIAKNPTMAINVGKNIKYGKIMQPHFPENTLAWIQTLDPNYGYLCHKVNLPNSYKKISVNCPVDVFVYDEKGECVAKIENDTAKEISYGVESYVDDDNQKVVILPVDFNYNISIVSRDKGKVSCNIAEYNCVTNKKQRVDNFYDIDIKAGDELELEIDKDDSSTSNYEVIKNGDYMNPINASETLSDDEAEKEYSVRVSSNVYGTVWGNDKKAKGEYAMVVAVPDDNSLFKGWYENNVLVSTDENYRFCVKQNRSLEAKFVPEKNNYLSAVMYRSGKDAIVEATLNNLSESAGSVDLSVKPIGDLNPIVTENVQLLNNEKKTVRLSLSKEQVDTLIQDNKYSLSVCTTSESINEMNQQELLLETSDIQKKVEITGYQMNSANNGIRVIYSTNYSEDEIDEIGMIYGVKNGEDDSFDDVYLNNANISNLVCEKSKKLVTSQAATSNGKSSINYSEFENGISYVQSMPFDTGVETYTKPLYERAYVKLTSGEIVYSDKKVVSFYDVAKELYEHNKLPSEEAYTTVYNTILKAVNPDFKEGTFGGSTKLAKEVSEDSIKNKGVEINGFSVSSTVKLNETDVPGGFKTIYSTNYGEDEVEECGLLLSIQTNAKDSDMVINGKNILKYVSSPKGIANYSCSNFKNARTYVMTMTFGKSYNTPMMTAPMTYRAYVKLKNGTIAYSKIERTTVLSVAEYAYENSMMPNLVSHNYLYENIIQPNDSNHGVCEYNLSKTLDTNYYKNPVVDVILDESGNGKNIKVLYRGNELSKDTYKVKFSNDGKSVKITPLNDLWTGTIYKSIPGHISAKDKNQIDSDNRYISYITNDTLLEKDENDQKIIEERKDYNYQIDNGKDCTIKYYTNKNCTIRTGAVNGAEVNAGLPTEPGKYYYTVTMPAENSAFCTVVRKDFCIIIDKNREAKTADYKNVHLSLRTTDDLAIKQDLKIVISENEDYEEDDKIIPIGIYVGKYKSELEKNAYKELKGLPIHETIIGPARYYIILAYKTAENDEVQTELVTDIMYHKNVIDTQGGTWDIPYILNAHGTALTMPKITKEGYLIDGWSNNAEGNARSYGKTIWSGGTLYANWVKEDAAKLVSIVSSNDIATLAKSGCADITATYDKPIKEYYFGTSTNYLENPKYVAESQTTIHLNPAAEGKYQLVAIDENGNQTAVKSFSVYKGTYAYDTTKLWVKLNSKELKLYFYNGKIQGDTVPNTSGTFYTTDLNKITWNYSPVRANYNFAGWGETKETKAYEQRTVFSYGKKEYHAKYYTTNTITGWNVAASSNLSMSYLPSNLLDKNTQTCWSNYKTDTKPTITFTSKGDVLYKVVNIKLAWKQQYAKKYRISYLDANGNWVQIKTETLTKADERVTNINKETKSIRIEVLERNTAYDNVSLGEAWIGYL